MEQVKWFSRKFDFNSQQNIFSTIIERLRGTPARLEEKVHYISPDILASRLNNTWTIKENIGHLTDLEPLWQGRLEDIVAGEQELREADLQNTRTIQANHDSVPLEELLIRFRQIRTITVGILEDLKEEHIFKSALHPQIKDAHANNGPVPVCG